MASDPCACGERFLLASKIALALEQDGPAAFVLVQQ